MPEILRSFFVVMAIAAAVFGVAQAYAKELGLDLATFKTRRNVWFAITAAAFLSHNFWLFCGIAAVVLLYAKSNEKNILAMVVFVLFAVPLFGSDISGLGVVNYIFELNYFRLISLVLLLPLYLHLRNEKGVIPFGRNTTDKFLFGYLLYSAALAFQHTTLTNFVRIIFGYIIDTFLPYYAATRYLKNTQSLTDVLQAFVIGAIVAGCIGMVEFAKGWLLYSAMDNALGAEKWGYGGYLLRGDSLRASGVTGQPIVLGFIMAVALGAFLWVQGGVQHPKIRKAIILVLLGGLVAPLSRGPWVGAIVMLLVFFAFQTRLVARIAKILIVLSVVGAAVLNSPVGNDLIGAIPYVGQVDAQNITFRQDLLTNAIAVISRNPFFGSPDFLATDEMESMRNGGDRGIIDVVNSYLAIALSGGLIGLFLFSGIFVSAAGSLFFFIRKPPLLFSERDLLACLLSVLMGVMVTIYTVSSITFIPIVYWIFCGLSVAAVQVYKKP